MRPSLAAPHRTAGVRMRSRRSTGAWAALAITAVAVAVATPSPAGADTTPQTLPFSQAWTNPALITVDDDWTGVPGVVGYLGDGLATHRRRPADGAWREGSAVDVNANQTNPNGFGTGGVAEFAITDPVVALQGSGTADAPHLVVTLSTAGSVDVDVAYNVRDIDGERRRRHAAARRPVPRRHDRRLHEPADGYVADATTGGRHPGHPGRRDAPARRRRPARRPGPRHHRPTRPVPTSGSASTTSRYRHAGRRRSGRAGRLVPGRR